MTPDSRFDPRIASSPAALDRPAPTATATDRTLEHRHLAALRVARTALLDAARRGNAAEVDAGIAPFVRAMLEADFSRPTICSLVAAAIDAGLPTGRGAARRAQRSEALARWTLRAGELADELVRVR